MVWLIVLSVVVLITVIAIYFINKPLNRIRRLGDLGINFGGLKGVYRERQLDRLTKMRVLGDLPPVYPNGWYCIAESEEIDNKQIKEVTVFGKILTLLRSEFGEVYLTDSYCPHLGANFNVGGKVVNDNCIQCPFHGWIFSAETGKCTKIPYDDGKIPEQAKITTWPVVERNEHIYVWYHCDGLDPEWDLPEIEEITSGLWTFGGRTEHEIMCHIQEIPENGADIAHLNYLHHAAPNEGHDIRKMDLPAAPLFYHVWNGSWSSKDEDNKHIGVMMLDQHVKYKEFIVPFTTSRLRAEQIGPGIVYMHFNFGWLGEGIVFQHITPEQPLLQKARFKMYSNMPRWFVKVFLWSEANQFERDIWVWSNKRYVKNPLLVKNDGPIQKHRRWFSQFYKENSPRLMKNGEMSNEVKSVNDW